ncbi:MAG: purine-nucleoside phosphorylase [Bryobacterales bacterium]|nr:purine-nucleoside phosphorylase [Bryobacterales bacterium]
MLEAAVQHLQSRAARRPAVAVVLGSGLGGFAGELDGRIEIPYAEIPGWPCPAVAGHAGQLVLGRLGNLDVAILAGRVHLYEGWTAAQAAFGVRVLGKLGVRTVVFTNAAGGINTDYARGSLVLIRDHINLQGANPLAGAHDESLGPRFPDMSEAYPERLRGIAREVAAGLGIRLPEGVYAAVLGPSFETPAEIRFLRTIGADLVGMSTVPEVIAANQMGLQVLAISCVTNMAAGLQSGKLSHQEVLETGEAVRGALIRYLKALLPRLES